MPNAICGNGGKVLVGTHEVAEMSNWDLTTERSPTEVPKYGVSREWVVCSPYSWSGSFSGNWYVDGDSAGQAALEDACKAGTTVSLVLSVDGTDQYAGSAYITQQAVGVPYDGIVSVSFNFQGSGTLTRT